MHGRYGNVWKVPSLKSQVYGVQPFDVATRAAACLLMAFAGLAAIWLPALRAAIRCRF